MVFMWIMILGVVLIDCLMDMLFEYTDKVRELEEES
jgi:hypothetical protein